MKIRYLLLVSLFIAINISLAEADSWTLNFIERDTEPWNRASSHKDNYAYMSVYVGSTLVKNYASIGTDYDYGNTSIDLSNNDPTGQQIKFVFYGTDTIYYLYNINLQKNGQYVKFTPWTATSTTVSDGSVHYDNSWREDRIVATIESNGGQVNFTSATVATAPELRIQQSGLTFNKTIYSINQGDSLQINATLNNIGTATDSGVVARLYINDVLTSTSSSHSIANGSSYIYSFAYTVDFAGPNRIKVTVQAVPSGTEGMAWNNNATKYILKHPYFYTTNFSNSPAVVYGGSTPYSGWLSTLASLASNDLSYDYTSGSASETTKAQKAMEMSLHGNINGLATYQNKTMQALLYAGKGNWCFLNRSFAGDTTERSGGVWTLYNDTCPYNTVGMYWGQITTEYSMAYDWDAPYIISYDAAHGTSYMTTIRDNVAHLCQDSYLVDKEMYNYPTGGDRDTVDTWGDWGTGKLAKEGGTGVCALAMLDYDGQYQNVDDNMFQITNFIARDTFQLGSKMTGAPESILQIQTTEDGIWEEGGGYQDYHEPTISYFMALYRYTFNQSLADAYPLAYGYATWILRAFAPTGQYPQMTTSYASPWYPQVNYYLSLNPTDAVNYGLGVYYTNYSIVPNKGYRGSGSGQGAGGDYGGYPELLLGYNTSASMATPSEPSYLFPQGTGAVLRSGFNRGDTYVYLRSAMNHTMSGHSEGTTQQLVFDIWAKGAYLIDEPGDPRFLGSPQDDDASTKDRATILAYNSNRNLWGWTTRDTKGTYESMVDPSKINTGFFTPFIDFTEGNMTVSSLSDTYAEYTYALPAPYSWTRSILMLDNNYVIVADRLASIASQQYSMIIPFGDSNGNTNANPIFNYARGNFTIDGTDYQWYDRVAGNPTPFSVTNAQKIVWKSLSETNTIDTTAYQVNMTVFLNPVNSISVITGHMHYGNYGQSYEWNAPLARVNQTGSNVKYLTVYYPTTTGDAQPIITNLTVTGGSGGNDYTTKVQVGSKTDIITASDGEGITAGPVSTDAQMSFSREENGLQYFFIRSGKKFSYNGISRVELSSAADNLIYAYNGENRSMNISGSGSTEITLNDLRTDFTYIVYRDGFAYQNWRMNNGSSMTITTTLSSHSFDIIANGHYPPSVTLNSPADNSNLTSSAVLFNCSAAGSILANISLWYNLGGWNQIAFANLTGTSASASWNITNLVEGSYLWNCKAFDTLGASSFAYSNNTFTIYVQCNESWNCSPWSECINSSQSRTCADLNGCNTTFNKPVENQSCIVGGCTENWACSYWSACINNQQTRQCVDHNSCNTTINKPSETQSCNSLPPAGGGNQGSGYHGGGGYSGGGGGGGCYESWSCTDWSDCSEDKQTRSCTDSSHCGTTRSKPPESQPCASNINIETLPSEIRINNGSSVDFELTASVKGTESDLKLNITGIPDNWFSITPAKFDFVTDQEVNYSIKLSIPSDANGTRDIQFQLVGSNLNSSVYTSSLVVVVPSAQRCGLVCKGNMVLDANKCICVCNITCPQVADLDNVSCLCKNSQPISNKPITPPAARDEPKYAVISPLVFVLIILALQLIWIIPLLVLLRIKRII